MDFLKLFSLRLDGGREPTGLDYCRLLEQIKGREDRHLLETVLLRSLKQAKFEPDNKGHFGLAYDAYCQFTSPIRRYPDLLVHRAIKHRLKLKAYKKHPYSEKVMKEIGEHCSMTERRADRATRDALDWLKCDYMKDKLGKTFSGIISDVVGFGLFIELDDIYIEGLVHISNIDDDFYHFDDVKHALISKSGNKQYRLGDRVKILVAAVNLDKRKIDFDLVN